LVPKQAHKTQEDATRRRGQGATTAIWRRWRLEELASRQQVEAGDPEQRIGQRNAPLWRGFTAVGAAQGRRDDALRRVQLRSGQRRLNDDARVRVGCTNSGIITGPNDTV